jgi:hemolysin III
MTSADVKASTKPLLRGHIHQATFFVTLGATPMLIAKSTDTTALIASSVYSLSLILLFGISALYHRPFWRPKPRAFMKCLDHSAIFVVIAGTFTPVCLLALNESHGRQLLLCVWLAALAGIFQSIFWVKAPKWLTAIFYVAMGYFILPYLGEVQIALGWQNIFWMIAGGVAYTVGAVCYAIRRPRFSPAVFGYHEVFHVLTVVGALFHFFMIYSLIH